MRARIVRLVLAYVRRRRGPAADALRLQLGLPATVETDDEVVLPLASLHDFLEAVERAAEDPFLGLHVAADYRRGAYGVMEFACRSAPTLRGAMLRIVRFSKLMNDHVEVTFDEKDGVAIIEQRLAASPLCLGRHANEFFVATLLDQARLLSGKPCVPTRVWFAHPRPQKVDELVTAIGTSNLEFQREANGFAWPSEVLDHAILTADPALLDVLEKHASVALAQLPAAPDFMGDVRAAIRECLRHEAPTVDRIASDLRLSPRTLQRRLTEEGTSFARVYESVREELARVYVADPDKPLAEIASLLRYAEVSAFLRAFKRWTGQTPRQFRG